MTTVTCIRESAYPDALTRGKKYPALEINEGKQQVKVMGDNHRIRWFPTYCFDLSGKDVPVLVNVKVRDTIEEPLTSNIEVDVELSDGQCRWCFFATPELLAKTGESLESTNVRIHYGVPQMIVVSAISKAIISHALQYIDGQGKLLDCTRPVE